MAIVFGVGVDIWDEVGEGGSGKLNTGCLEEDDIKELADIIQCWNVRSWRDLQQQVMFYTFQSLYHAAQASNVSHVINEL